MNPAREREAQLRVIDLTGHTRHLPYDRYVRFQTRLRDARRELVLFCQHPPTVTAGVQGREESLAVPPGSLADRGVAHERVGRGGDYTAHEPGQLVVYVHLDLAERGLSIGELVSVMLNQTAASLNSVWGVEARRLEGLPGLYVPHSDLSPERWPKICSIGLMFKSFFTSFGMALNVSNTLATFDLIHPCGEAERPMTSVSRLGGDASLGPEFARRWRVGFQQELAL